MKTRVQLKLFEKLKFENYLKIRVLKIKFENWSFGNYLKIAVLKIIWKIGILKII